MSRRARLAYRLSGRVPGRPPTGRRAAAAGPFDSRHPKEDHTLLTPRQRAVYDFIASFRERQGFAPAVEGISRHRGVASQ